MVPYSAGKFAVYERLKKIHYFSAKNQPNTKLENFLNGFVASWVTLTLTYPTDVVRRIVQTNVVLGRDAKVGLWETVSELGMKEGVRGFYRGLCVTYVKVGPMMGFAFMINDMMKELLQVK